MFKVVGLSRQNGSLKLRFANDFVTRSKVLARNGHTDINLVELPMAMTKDAAVAYISGLTQFADVESQAAISQFTKTSDTPDYSADQVNEDELKAEKLAEKRAKDAARKREKRAEAKAEVQTVEKVAEAA